MPGEPTRPPGGGRVAPVVCVLGAPTTCSTDGRSQPVRGHAGRLLSAIVAKHPASASRDELVEVLWPDGPPSSAAAAFRVHLSRLRRILGDVGVELRGEGSALRLPGADRAVDVLVAEALADDLRRALRTDADPEAAARLAQEALALFRGVPFEGMGDAPAISAARARAEHLGLELEELAIEAALAAGHHEQAAGQAELLVMAEPLRERRWAQLVVAHYRCGRPSAALEAAQRARRSLGELLGIEPGPELQHLERSVLLHDPALLLEGAPGRREPSHRPALVGRRDVLDRIGAALATHRLVTVVGPAGSGTSAVVATFARERAPEGSSSVTTAALDDLGDRLAGEVAPTPPAAGPPHLAVVDLGSGAPEAAAQALPTLLDRWPHVAALVASRAPLDLPGEHVVELDPLSASEGLALLRDVVGSTGSDADLASVVASVGGHPLSLRLAAGWIDLLGPAAARELERGALALTSGAQEVVGAVAAARSALDPRFAAALDHVAWFRGDVDVDAVAAVGDLDAAGAAMALRAWQRAGLVQRGRSPGRWGLPSSVRDALRSLGEEAGTATTGRRRRREHLVALTEPHRLPSFGLHAAATCAALGPWHDELLALGAEALDAGDLTLVGDVSEGLVWYWEAAGRVPDADRWFTDVMGALDAHDGRPGRARVLALAATSGPTIARLVERAARAEACLEEASGDDDAPWAALAHLGIAARCAWAGDAAGGRAALATAAGGIDPSWRFVATYLDALAALAAMAAGQLALAERELELAHHRFGELGSPYGELLATLWLGWLARAAGDRDRALACNRRALALAEAHELPEPDHPRIELAELLVEDGRTSEARRHLERAVVGRLAVGDRGWAADCLCGIAEIALADGRRVEAVAALRHALQLGWQAQDAASLVRAGVDLAELHLAAGAWREAAVVLGTIGEAEAAEGRRPRDRDRGRADELRATLLRRQGDDAATALQVGEAGGLVSVVAGAGLAAALGATAAPA